MLEFAWWSPQQFEHLKEWGHSSLCFVSNHGGFIFALALQHHVNWQQCSNLWDPLHHIHLASWIWHEKVECPYLQQFLHWGTLGFMLVPQIVTMYLSMLKHLLMSILTLLLLCTFYISIQTIVMSNFGDTLMMWDFDTNVMLLKMWLFLIIFSTIFKLRRFAESS